MSRSNLRKGLLQVFSIVEQGVQNLDRKLSNTRNNFDEIIHLF